MDPGDRKSHWERVYERKAPTDLSWYQAHPERSLELIRRTGAGPGTRIIDVGGGDSMLVDVLLDEGMRNIAVLDISRAALDRARERLGSRAAGVDWIEADVTSAQLVPHSYNVWHDRAVFHFLTGAEDRRLYVDAVRASLTAGGHAIIATFADNGPTRCSGLEVARYSPTALRAEFGDGFDLVANTDEVHLTPMGMRQHFTYCLCRKRA